MERDDRPIFVVSDAHLGADDPDAEREKSQRLIKFWDHVGKAGGDLVVLGDLFDFWFEYRNAIPRFHFDHLVALKRLVQGGCTVWYVAGNHDFWAGPFLRDELGINFCPDELELERHGSRIVCAHADGWLPRERGYRLMKAVLRNRMANKLFRLISPDIGFPLARWVSGRSRGRHELEPGVIETYAGLARDRIEKGTQLLITAHLHALQHRRWRGGEWISTGDWMQHFSFVRIDGRGAGLYLWRDNGDHRPAAEVIADLDAVRGTTRS